MQTISTKLVGAIVLASITVFAGCESNHATKAEAILRVDRQSFDSADEFQMFRRTQANLIKSTFVLSRALSDQDMPKGVTPAELAQTIAVELPNNSELISVLLPLGSRSPNVTEAILNTVVDAYRSEIINTERLQKIEELSKLRIRYQRTYDDFVKTNDQINTLSEQLGLTSHGLAPGADIAFLKQRLVDLQLARIQGTEEADDTDESKSKLKVLDKKIAFLQEEIDAGVTELRQDASGELRAKKAVLTSLQQELLTVRKAKTALEMQIEGRDRVQIIQKAYCASLESDRR